MSAENSYRLIITGPGKRDFQDILLYTARKWGETQRIKYKSKLDAALLRIKNNPHQGRFKLGYMVYNAERHLIFYKILGREIFIMRMLHEKMEAVRYLDKIPNFD